MLKPVELLLRDWRQNGPVGPVGLTGLRGQVGLGDE